MALRYALHRRVEIDITEVESSGTTICSRRDDRVFAVGRGALSKGYPA